MDFEMKYGGMAFEEIMHQLPWIKEFARGLYWPGAWAMNSGEIRMEYLSDLYESG